MTPTTLLAAIAITLTQYALPENWGTLRGQILLDGPVPPPQRIHRQGDDVKDAAVCSAADLYREDLVVDPATHGLQHVFVYLYRAPRKIHPSLKDITSTVNVHIRRCAFVPHTLLVQAGQQVAIASDDDVLHNPHVFPLRNTPPSILMTPRAEDGRGFVLPFPQRESLPMRVTCDFHLWMEAYWLILDHPYMAITDSTGRFTIPHLPVGEYEFRLWHERAGYLDRRWKVTVAPGENRRPPRLFPLSDFLPDDDRQPR